ncbi:MAG: LTA synthase family protein [Clostridia bacterium]|nr:LTA synthase family protein [Clostridia bacterium]
MSKDNKIKEDNTVIEKKNRPNVIFTVLVSVLFLVGISIFFALRYFNNTYGIDFTAIYYTIMSPLKGTDSNVVTDGITEILPTIIAIFSFFLVFFLFSRLRRSRGWKAVKLTCIVLGLAAVPASLITTFYSLGVDDFIYAKNHPTEIYENYYVKPDADNVVANGKTKNLIYIYLESMETTYASTDIGGYQTENYMPHLTALAKENVSFSDKSEGLLGGFCCSVGSGWTMGAILSSTSGVPFSFPVEGNSIGESEHFASGLVTLGDLLEEYGYTQEFLCGSDAVFGGRKSFYVQHGDYDIFDLFTAREQGFVPEDYAVWWGFEDLHLYEIAKHELTRLASLDEPFNLTMLTADTHHVEGYVCSLCRNDYPDTTANVVACADRQLAEFIDWIKAQDFYEDTVIVITGDHPRMDTCLVESVDYYDRMIYNCFINSAAEVQGNTYDRVFTTLDMFPTILESMGFDVVGDRLGLGTSMFSYLPTLAEEMGFDEFNAELQKYSDYYINNFS